MISLLSLDITYMIEFMSQLLKPVVMHDIGSLVCKVQLLIKAM